MTTVNSLKVANDYFFSTDVVNNTGQNGNNTAASSAPGTTPEAPTDTITLSAEATATLAGTAVTTKTDSQVSYYAQFLPTRDGGGTVFAENVIDPAAATISTGLSASGIAQAARKSMDAEYSAMTASGQPFNYDGANGTDWYTLMSGLDRTALSAVSSNQDGLFSTKEQGMAQYIMLQQEHFAMGNYAGPTNLEAKFVARTVSGQGYSDDFSQAVISQRTNITQKNVSWIKNLSLYLDKASSYEKSTVEWAFDRASAQTAYGIAMGAANQPEDPKYLSSFSIVGMLSELMKNGQKQHLMNHPTVMNISDLLNEEWAKGHEAAIQAALKKTRTELGYAQS